MNAKLVVLVTRCDNKNPVQIVKKKKKYFSDLQKDGRHRVWILAMLVKISFEKIQKS